MNWDFRKEMQLHTNGTVHPNLERDLIKKQIRIMDKENNIFKRRWFDDERFFQKLTNDTSFVRVDKFIDQYFEGANFTVYGRIGHSYELQFCNIPRFMDIEIAYFSYPHIDNEYTLDYVLSKNHNEYFTFNILFKKEDAKKKNIVGLLVPLTKNDQRVPNYYSLNSELQEGRDFSFLDNSYAHILEMEYKRVDKAQWYHDGYFDHETFEEGLLKAINKHNKHIGRSVVTGHFLDQWDEELTYQDKWGQWHFESEVVDDKK